MFQRRFDGSLSFTRSWAEYRDGFGEPTGEFWLGNEILRKTLKRRRKMKLRIDLEDDKGESHTLQAGEFKVSGVDYTLTHGESTEIGMR